MRFLKISKRAYIAILLFLATPVFAGTAELSPEAAAGKIIFEETAGDVGCSACHGADGQGDSAPAITGMDADSIRDQLDYNEDMTFIELTDEEIDQVVAYLSLLDH